MSDAPERIWGGVYTSEITTYKPFHSAVGYVREDLYEAAMAENARLREIMAAQRSGAVWVCPDCDIVFCKHYRAALQETDK